MGRVRDSCSGVPEPSTLHTQRPEKLEGHWTLPFTRLKCFEEILPSESPDSRGDGLRGTFRLWLLMNQKHIHRCSLEALFFHRLSQTLHRHRHCRRDGSEVLYLINATAPLFPGTRKLTSSPCSSRK